MTQLQTGGQHETAIVDSAAVVAESATIGPYAVIGPDVEIGERVRIGPHVYIERDTRIAEDVHISNGAVLGTDPQDLKYAGERTFLEIGARTRIREFATLNRGTAASGLTSVGVDALIMSYAHVAHDCRVGNHAVIANAVNMAGHVEIGDWAIVGGLTGIHQFVRIGRHSMVGGAARIVRDVAPYTIATGTPPVSYGINRVGLKRRGFDAEAIRALRATFKDMFRSGTASRAVAESYDLSEASAEVRELVEFVRESRRGIVPGRSEGDVGDEPEDASADE